jgi:hypothetical protein
MRAMVFHGTANQMGPGPADSEMRPSIFGLTNHRPHQSILLAP